MRDRYRSAVLCNRSHEHFKNYFYRNISDTNFRMNVLQTMTGLLLRPVATFPELRNEPFFKTAVYYGALLLLNAALSAILSSLHTGQDLHLFSPLTQALTVLFLGITGVVFFALVLHAGINLSGRKHGKAKTVKLVFYSLTPVLLTSWVLGYFSPNGIIGLVLESILFCIGILTGSVSMGSALSAVYLALMGTWSAGLVVIGIREFHNLAPENTAGTVLAGFGAVVLVLFIVVIPLLMILFAVGWGPGVVW
jgi:hypothetical protein